MMQYPYNSPQILTDTIFVMYGGQIGTSTTFQRSAAFLLAEEQMTEHLNAFLVPTTITGSISIMRNGLFETEYGWVSQIYSVSFEKVKQVSPFQTEVNTGTAVIKDSQNGYLAVFVNCPYEYGYKGYATYQSGLSTGTSNQPAMRAALTLAAQINLNEMDVSLSNEGVADIGVQRFSNQAYSEDRKYLGHTVFGNSAMAQRIARLVKKYRSKTAVALR